MKKHVVLIAAIALLLAFAVACTPGNSGTEGGQSSRAETESATSSQTVDESEESDESYTGGWGLVSDDFIDEFVERYRELEDEAVSELEDRRTAEPKHYAIGEEAQITDNLAVRIDSVEAGPYDYADRTPTVKVTATMRNLSDHTVWVKPSNFDADGADGRRLDHKVYVKDENGNRDVRSFYPTKVSPGASFTGEVYFDGEALVSVIYVPHFLVSSENQYVYFDL